MTDSIERALIPLQGDRVGRLSGAGGLDLVRRGDVRHRKSRERDSDQDLHTQRHRVLLGANRRPAWAIIDLASATALASARASASAIARLRW
jgi:hypothetical protein